MGNGTNFSQRKKGTWSFPISLIISYYLQKFLLYLRYQDVSWEYAEPQDKDNPDCMPCLFLQFAARENGEEVTKLLQIFSREVICGNEYNLIDWNQHRIIIGIVL